MEEEVSVAEGRMVSLLCDVQAYPPPEITWTRDGQVLAFASGIHILPGQISATLQGDKIISLVLCEGTNTDIAFSIYLLKVARCCSCLGQDWRMLGNMCARLPTRQAKTKRALCSVFTVSRHTDTSLCVQFTFR